MEAAASTMQHGFGHGPQGPNPSHGAPRAQGPHRPAQGLYGAARPEDQHQQPQPQPQHPKPFFYVQPSQPFLPLQNLQWPMHVPMPMSYNPYFGYPGLGYGMPVMPQYQPSPYMDPPGYVLPHSHHHLIDYRRMLNPHYYQTMAYHARRFRYQHNAPAREMTSSEVQTEPLLATLPPGSLVPGGGGDGEAFSGLPACSDNDPDKSTGGPAGRRLSPALAVNKGGRSDHQEVGTSSVARAPAKSSFIIQTEEVRIECCSTPVGLKVVRSCETAELARSYSHDVVGRSSVQEGHAAQEAGSCAAAEQSEQGLQTCPDILLVGTPTRSGADKIPATEESSAQAETVSASPHVDSRVTVHSDALVTTCDEDLTENRSSKSVHFKVLRLPFDLKYLEEPRKMESTVWSMEETSMTSTDWLLNNALMESQMEYQMEPLTPTSNAPFADELLVRERIPMEQVVPMIELPPSMENPVVEVPVVEMASVSDLNRMTDVPIIEVAFMSEVTTAAEVTLTASTPLRDNPLPRADFSQQGVERNKQVHLDTSFESLPDYLPSASWLADFSNVYCRSKMPQAPQKRTKAASICAPEVTIRRRKLNLDCKEPHAVKLKGEKCKNKVNVDRRSLSDHECCLNRNFNENAFAPGASRGERLCARCLAKRRSRMAVSPGLEAQILKRKAVPFQPWDDSLLPTCEACRTHSKKPVTGECSGSDARGRHRQDDTEGETSENGSCRTGPKWTALGNPRKTTDPKRPLASKWHSEKCPVAQYPTLREKNCACDEPQPAAWEALRRRVRGNAIQEMNENFSMSVPVQDKWRNMDQRYLGHKWPTEKPWKASVPHTDRSQHLNKQKKPQPQSQGTHRKDTRC